MSIPNGAPPPKINPADVKFDCDLTETISFKVERPLYRALQKLIQSGKFSDVFQTISDVVRYLVRTGLRALLHADVDYNSHMACNEAMRTLIQAEQEQLAFEKRIEQLDKVGGELLARGLVNKARVLAKECLQRALQISDDDFRNMYVTAIQRKWGYLLEKGN